MKLSFFFQLLLAIFVFVSCEKSPKPQIYEGNALGTTFSMQFFHSDELMLSSSIDSTFTVLNQSLSTYISTSDISKINDGDTTIEVDNQFVTNFETAKRIYQETDAYFDPSVGILVNAYGFGPRKYNININDEKVIDSLMQFVGFDKFQINSSNTLEFPNGAFLDFNAIAKGYAVDRLGVLLEQNNIEDFLIEVGGELVGKGFNQANGNTWRIGVEDPDSPVDDRSFSHIVELNGYGMATSGNYRKFSVDDQGNRFVHTINPKTGKSEKTDVISATVIANTCMEADAYATAFMAMGAEKSREFLQKYTNVHALLYVAVGDEIQLQISDGFQAFIVD